MGNEGWGWEINCFPIFDKYKTRNGCLAYRKIRAKVKSSQLEFWLCWILFFGIIKRWRNITSELRNMFDLMLCEGLVFFSFRRLAWNLTSNQRHPKK